MADFTSTTDGDWEDGASWGNTSPGVKGTDYPGDADTATIGDTIAYDAGDNTTDEYNDITISSGGVLNFPTSSDSTLQIDETGVLTVESGGTLNIGTSSAVIDSANFAHIDWAQGASARTVFDIEDGGIVNIYGDPDFYGEKYASLDSDWTTGQTLYVAGDLTSSWAADHKFYIHENKLYSDYQTDGHIYTIATVGSYDSGNDRTPITISESAPSLTFTAVDGGYTSQLILISRNVELRDPAMSVSIYAYNGHTPRLRMDIGQATGNDLININDASLSGWDWVCNGGYNLRLENGILINNYWNLSNCISHNINADIISNSRAVNTDAGFPGMTITGVLASNNIAFNICRNVKLNGDLISNLSGFYASSGCTIVGDAISNETAMSQTYSCKFNGQFVNNETAISGGYLLKADADFADNTYCVTDGESILLHGDFTNNTNIYNPTVSVNKTYAVLDDSTIEGTDRAELRIYQNSGNILPLFTGDTGWQTPPSGESWVLQMSPNSGCSDTLPGQLIFSPMGEMAAYRPAGSLTLNFSVYPVGWSTSLDQDDIIIEAVYLAGTSIERTTIVNPTTFYVNGGWRDLEVSFTTGQAGNVYFQIYLRRYESGAYVLVDPEWSI